MTKDPIHNSSVWDDETAEWYSEVYGNHFSTTLAVEMASLNQSDIVLDIGCGSGNSCRAAALIATEGQVIGIDPTPAMIRISKELSQNQPSGLLIQYITASAEAIPISNEYVTVVMVINSIHHWNDIITGLSEVQRVLKTHGRFFVADELKSDGTTHGEGKLSDPQNIVRLLSESGFTDIEQTQYKHGKEEMIFFSSGKK